MLYITNWVEFTMNLKRISIYEFIRENGGSRATTQFNYTIPVYAIWTENWNPYTHTANSPLNTIVCSRSEFCFFLIFHSCVLCYKFFHSFRWKNFIHHTGARLGASELRPTTRKWWPVKIIWATQTSSVQSKAITLRFSDVAVINFNFCVGRTGSFSALHRLSLLISPLHHCADRFVEEIFSIVW